MLNEKVTKNHKKSTAIILIVILIFCATFFFCTGFFVIQPIGAFPDGITIWYFRAGLNLPFITSPDGFSLQQTGSLSLLGRMSAMGAISEIIQDRIILRLPYSRSLYLQSTGGKEFKD